MLTAAAPNIDTIRELLEQHRYRLVERTEDKVNDYDLWRRGVNDVGNVREVWLWHDGSTWDAGVWQGPCTEVGLEVLERILKGN